MFFLYSTSGCHLCDEAKSLLESVGLKEVRDSAGQDDFFALKVIDIANDELLFERYGVNIPVVANSESGKELAWPFDLLSAREFVRAT